MLKGIGQDDISPEAIPPVLPFDRELVALTRQEPLSISYELFADDEDPGHFVFIETWPDHDALDQHCDSEHFRRLVPQIDAFQRESGTATRMRAVFPDDR